MTRFKQCVDGMLSGNNQRIAQADSSLRAGEESVSGWPQARQTFRETRLPALQERQNDLRRLHRPLPFFRLRMLTVRVSAYRLTRWIDPRILYRLARIAFLWFVLNIELIIWVCVLLAILAALVYATVWISIHAGDIKLWFDGVLQQVKDSFRLP